MDSIQETLLLWYHQDILRYAVVSTVAVFAVGMLLGLAADMVTKLLGIGAERLTSRRETRGRQ